MLQKQVKELTEGMQNLCAIANKVVSSEGRVEAIERDLLLDALRRLYEIALQLDVRGNAAPAKAAEPENEDENEAMPDAEMISSTVMATMAAMGVAAEPKPELVEPEPEPVEPEPEPEPVSMAGLETESGLLFDEVVLEPEAQPANTLEEDYSSEQPAPETEPVKPEPELVEPEPESVEPEPEPEPIEPEPEFVQPKPEPEPAGEQSSLLDYLRHPVQEQPATRTLGESLGGGSSAESGFERTMARKVDDLRTVININDKFSFMSELFRNNMRAYNDFIMYLNTLNSRDEALAYVKQVAEQYKWDENSLAVKAFYKVFDMKF